MKTLEDLQNKINKRIEILEQLKSGAISQLAIITNDEFIVNNCAEQVVKLANTIKTLDDKIFELFNLNAC
jgi:hypothetical protein